MSRISPADQRQLGGRRRVLLAVALTALSGAAFVQVATAAPAALPIPSVTTPSVTWTTLNNSTCRASNAFNIQDAALGAQVDAYDNAFCMSIGGVDYVAPASVDVTGTTVTAAAPTTLSGLSTTYQFAFMTTRPAVRVLASFTNPTAAPITVPVTFETDLGSDAATVVPMSSSGDTTFSAADRWAITNGDVDPSLAHIIAGPGTPVTLPATAGIGVNAPVCTAPNANNGSWCATFNLTVPPDSTRRLMLVDELAPNGPAAVTAAQLYSTLATVPAEVLADLTPLQMSEIVNWDLFGATSVAPTTLPRDVPTLVTLTGRSFSSAMSVNMGADVTTGPVTVTSPTTATFTAVATLTAALGPRNLTIGIPGRTAICSSCFFVTTPAGPPILGSAKLIQPKSRVGFTNALLMSLSERAVVNVVVEQLVRGRKKGAVCSATAKTGTRCTKIVKRGTLTGTQDPGASIGIVIPAKIGGKALKAGKYRLTIKATDLEGNVSAPKQVTLTLTR